MRPWLAPVILMLSLAVPVQAGRDFNGTTQNAEVATGIVSVEPLTVCQWFNLDAVDAHRRPFSMGNNGSTGGYMLATINTDTSIRANKQSDGGASSDATKTGVLSAATWTLACGVFITTTNRWIYVNGSSGGVQDTTSVGSTTPDSTAIGVEKKSGYGVYFDGKIGWTAIWNVALTTIEIDALAGRACPKRIRPDSLVSLVPLWGASSPEPDLRGARSWTLLNSPSASAGPPVTCLGRR